MPHVPNVGHNDEDYDGATDGHYADDELCNENDYLQHYQLLCDVHWRWLSQTGTRHVLMSWQQSIRTRQAQLDWKVLTVTPFRALGCNCLNRLAPVSRLPKCPTYPSGIHWWQSCPGLLWVHPLQPRSTLCCSLCRQQQDQRCTGRTCWPEADRPSPWQSSISLSALSFLEQWR